MAIIQLSLSAGQVVSAVFGLPFPYEAWTGQGVSCLMNFSGNGVNAPNTLPAVPGTPATGTVTLQVSNDPNASSSSQSGVPGRWNNHDILVAITADKNDSLVFPCRFVRLVGTVSAGTVVCIIGAADASNPAG